MGVKLLPPRLYKSELANSESLRDMLLLVELDTVKGVENRTFKIYIHRHVHSASGFGVLACGTNQKIQSLPEPSPVLRRGSRRCC